MYDSARCVAGAPITVSFLAFDADGEPSGADPGTVTVGVVNAEGDTVVSAGTATAGSGTAARTYTITAANTATLDQLTVTWTASGATVYSTLVDVVGGVYATVAEIRGVEDSLGSIPDDPTATIIRCRGEVEKIVERACGHVLAFVPRFATATVKHYRGEFVLPHYNVRRVRWVRYTDSSGTSQEVDITGGVRLAGGTACILAGVSTTLPLTVGYEHGFPAPPDDVKRAAIAAIRRQVNLAKSQIDSRAMSWQGPAGEFLRFPTPGLGPWVTGVPEIDEVLADYAKRYPVAGIA